MHTSILSLSLSHTHTHIRIHSDTHIQEWPSGTSGDVVGMSLCTYTYLFYVNPTKQNFLDRVLIKLVTDINSLHNDRLLSTEIGSGTGAELT